MKLSLHRSIIFWSGLFVMLFLAWAWRDSMVNQSSASTSRLTAANAPGCFSLFHKGLPVSGPALGMNRTPHNLGDKAEIPAITAPYFMRGGGGDFPGSPIHRGDSFQDIYLRIMAGRPASDWVLMIPHWLVLSLAGGLWSALLVWRARRRRKASDQELTPDS